MREVAELNERVMAQNIALMADLEAAQRVARELRAGKDALAAQLQRAGDRGGDVDHIADGVRKFQMGSVPDRGGRKLFVHFKTINPFETDQPRRCQALMM